jgi:hypothetical protein
VRRLAAVLIVVAAALAGAVRGMNAKTVPGDFLRYHRAGRLVWTGRAELVYDEEFLAQQSVYAAEREPGGEDDLKEMEFKYAPATAVLMAPLGALSPRTASAIWMAWNTALIAAMLVAVWGWCGAGLSPWWMAVPLAELVRTMQSNLTLGQLNPSAIVPATIGMALLARGRDRAAGALVGVGAVAKYMPGVLAIWLAWKRRWAALAACAAVVVGLGVVLPAVVLGPSRAAALTRTWVDVRAHHYTEASSPDLPGYSVKSFVYRTLGDTPFVTFSADDGPVVVGWNVLSPGALRAAYLAIDALLVAAALWFSRGALRGANDPRGPPEASLLLAALPLVSPEARYPHFLFLALPVTALVCALVRGRNRTGAWFVAAALGAVGAFCLNAPSDHLVGERLSLMAEVYCVPGWGALAIAAALVVMLRRRPTDGQTPVA